MHVFRISRSNSYIKVIASRSKSVCVVAYSQVVCLRLKDNFVYVSFHKAAQNTC